MTIKVGDFGLARQLYSKDYYKLQHRAKVPIKWMPLESIHDGIFNEKTDVVCLIQYLCTHTLQLLFTVGIWCDLLGGIHAGCNPILCFRVWRYASVPWKRISAKQTTTMFTNSVSLNYNKCCVQYRTETFVMLQSFGVQYYSWEWLKMVRNTYNISCLKTCQQRSNICLGLV